MQDRLGPNRVGPQGILQPAADGLKNFLKEETSPAMADKALFTLAPLISFVPALLTFGVIPFASPLPTPWGVVPMVVADLPIGFLYILAISSLGVYGIVLAGWASNNKYALLGGLRASAQMISYEIALGMSTVAVLLLAGNVTLSHVIAQQQHAHAWFIVPLTLGFVIFFVSALAETNRPPFDLVEAESELVAGFMVEYGSTPYMMFMLGEYVAIGTMCAMGTILFLGGWLSPVPYPPFTWIPGVIWFTLKAFFFFFMFAMVKAIVPRYRYDQLMRLGWKVFLPLSLAMVVIVAAVVKFGLRS
jgi:NADH-quinone oxidoreductase subunit H